MLGLKKLQQLLKADSFGQPGAMGLWGWNYIILKFHLFLNFGLLDIVVVVFL